jgi:hypothetical protein
MEAQRADLRVGEAFTPAQCQKFGTGKANVIQQAIIFAFQQERSRAAQLRKGEEAGEHDETPVLEA